MLTLIPSTPGTWGWGHGWYQGHESYSCCSCCRFHLAAMRGNVDCLEAMLAHGVDAMTKDSSGEGMATTCLWLMPHSTQGHQCSLVGPALLAEQRGQR